MGQQFSTPFNNDRFYVSLLLLYIYIYTYITITRIIVSLLESRMHTVWLPEMKERLPDVRMGYSQLSGRNFFYLFQIEILFSIKKEKQF